MKGGLIMKANNLKVLATCLFILTSFVFSGCAQQSMTGTMDENMEPTMDTMNEQKMETPMGEKTDQNMGDTAGEIKDPKMDSEKEKMMK